MKCYKCGYVLPEDSEFCQYCGVKLGLVSNIEESTNTTLPVEKVASLDNTCSENTNRDSDSVENGYDEESAEINAEREEVLATDIQINIEEEKVNRLAENASKKSREVDNNEVSFNKKNSRNKKHAIYTVVSAVGLVAIALSICIIVYINNKIDLQAVDKAMVKIVCYGPFDNIVSTGSGFFYKDDLHIVTNYHVIKDAYKISYITDDDISYDIEYIYYYSKEMDIAVLEAKETVNDYIYLKSRTKTAKRGEEVFAIGSPLGIKNVLSQGIISGDHMIDGINAVQFTAPISSGSSGGALLDSKGRVLGITFASYENGQNINLAVPIQLLDKTCPEWNNSMHLKTIELYSKNYEFEYDIEVLQLIAKKMSIDKNIQVVSFDELKKNNEYYKKNKVIAFEAYISSVYTPDADDNSFYFLSDANNVTGNSDYDMIEYYKKGISGSPFICVSTIGNKDDQDHIDEISDGTRVWVVCFGSEFEAGYMHNLLLLYDENSGKYISVVPSVAEEMFSNGITYNNITYELLKLRRGR